MGRPCSARAGAADVRSAVRDDLRQLERQWGSTVPGAAPATEGAPPPAGESRSPAQVKESVNAVNHALQQADDHAAALKDLPER
ncbi:hypothetical protein ACFYWY_11200 [Streptomyces sp. NPDC002870]|uniref:hypothetical protein n=1 Tax=Streptomyces sp. NPDC002870 TaxID=3364666 RepID=UPI00368FD441